MYIIQAMAKSEFWGGFYNSLFDDMIGFAVLCVACVLMLSYLRGKPPEFEKKRVFCAGAVLVVGAFLSRILAHYAEMIIISNDITSTVYLTQYKTILFSAEPFFPEDILAEGITTANYDNVFVSAFINTYNGSFFQVGQYQIYILICTAFTTVISLISICIGAFILMKIFSARHITPMIIVQTAGYLHMLVSRVLYQYFIGWLSASMLSKKIEKVELFGYKGFAYGCLMIIMIIGYILVTKQQYESFWTKNSHVGMHILSLIVLFLGYTSLILIYNSNKERMFMAILGAMIHTFLAAGLLYVPKVTYNLTRGELQEEFFEVKRKEEVEQYSYSETQIKAQRKYMHDLPGHFRAIASLAEKIGADEIVQYVQELDEKLIESKGEFSTGNAFLDDFLYSKKKLAQQNNIDIVFNGAFPNEGVKRIDITTIFHNLIENAIEACKTVPGKREIVISSKIHEDRVYISISNPFEKKTKKEQGRFETNKKNKGFHGYGLSSVESIAGKKEYDGTFSKRRENNAFIAEVNLKYKQ